MSAAIDPPTHRLTGLDGIRGMACVMVFLYHLRWHAQPSTENPIRVEAFGVNFEPILSRFDSGVAIFFVLSGLLLSLPYWRAILQAKPTPAAGPYLWRRACRIVPAYYSVLIAVYLIRPGTYTFHGGIDFLLHASFLHTFSDSSYYGVYPLLWTIGIEFQFYLILPLVMGALARIHHRKGATLALLALFAGTFALDLATRQTLSAIAPAVPDRFLADHESAVIGGTIFSYLKLFAFGICAGYLFLSRRMTPRSGDILAGLSLVTFLIVIAAGREAGWRETALTGWPMNAIAIAGFLLAVPQSRCFAALFSMKPVAAFGVISYGVYLWHELIQRAVFGGTLPNQFQGFPLFAIGGFLAFAATVAVSALSWRFLEKPALHTPCPFGR
jgi:peptidoglycan/LPS O-acetylase OafA/YrhL